VWVIDRVRADSAHTFTWQAHLPPQAKIESNVARVSNVGNNAMTIAWSGAGAPARLTPIPHFPARGAGGMCWPWDGSARLELDARGATCTFAVCIVPSSVKDLRV